MLRSANDVSYVIHMYTYFPSTFTEYYPVCMCMYKLQFLFNFPKNLSHVHTCIRWRKCLLGYIKMQSQLHSTKQPKKKWQIITFICLCSCKLFVGEGFSISIRGFFASSRRVAQKEKRCNLPTQQKSIYNIHTGK